MEVRRNTPWPLVTGLVAIVATSCATPTPVPAPALPAPVVAAELSVDRTCAVIVDVADAAARGALVSRRHALELLADSDRHAAFGLMLAEPTPEERFSAFHREQERAPDSVVGVLGECLVYSSWSKMGPQAKAACDLAATRLGDASVIVEVARSSSALLHDGDAARAVAIADAAIVRAPGCTALRVVKAQAIAAAGDVNATRDGWRAASAAAPGCFRCLVEAAAAEERADTGAAGRAAAVPLWEEALKLAPDHPDTLRRFAAAAAGVDDKRAQQAYAAAVRAGAKDYPTLLGAARLSARLADSPAAVDEAIGFARKASDAARADPEPRRIVVELSSRKAAHDDVLVAANALLDLVPDDAVAHIALAKVAMARGPLSAAVVHYDAADRAVVANPVDQPVMDALQAERRALLTRLMVDDAKAPSGTAAAVAAATQKQLQALWRDRIAKRTTTKGGDLVVVVETGADGRVASATVGTDTVGDDEIAAAAVAWLSRATIKGGARRYTLEFALR